MRGALATEWLKLRRTVIPWLAIGVPVLLAAALGTYARAAGHLAWPWLFASTWEMWAILALPVGLGLLTGLNAQVEQQAGNWLGLRTRPVSPGALLSAKLLMLALLTLASTLLFAGLMLLVGVLGGAGAGGAAGGLPGATFLAAALLVWLAALPLLALHVWLATGAGFGPTMGLGGVGLLVAALIGGTSLGDGVWRWVPWAWPVRLVYAALALWPGGLPGFGAAASSFVPPLLFMLLPTLGLAAALLVLALRWFARWEPQPMQE